MHPPAQLGSDALAEPIGAVRPRNATGWQADPMTTLEELPGSIVLGTATMGLHARSRSRDGDLATLRLAYELGVRAFDTARVYAPADDDLYPEELLAEALADRDDTLVMTKGGHFRTADGGFAVDNTPERLRRDVTASLRALHTERLGLYFLHRADDETVPIEESVAALARLRGEGKLAAIGLSNVRLDQLERALEVAPIAAVQNQYSPYSDRWSPLTRAECNAVLAACEARGIVHLAYSPLNGRGDRPALDVLRELLSLSPAMAVVSGASRPETVRDVATLVR